MQKVYDYIQKHRMIHANDKVAVGVSGGADSLCLLFLLKDYQRKNPFDMTVIHVEHGIRGEESLEDAAYVEELCKKENLTYRCVKVDAPAVAKKDGLTLEEGARKARYEAFEQICMEIGADCLALAHNQNDQAETMLFQMARGSGLAGAGGIRPVRKVRIGGSTQCEDCEETADQVCQKEMFTIIRPLLDCSRTEIEEYLKESGIVWRNDSTNQDVTYTRNSVRHVILPQLEQQVNQQTVRHLAVLGEELQGVEEYMAQQARMSLKNMRQMKESLQDAGKEPEAARCKRDAICCRRSAICLDIHILQEQPKILQEYIIREALKDAECGLKDITRGHIESILSLTHMQSGKRITLPGGWGARREFQELVIHHNGLDTRMMQSVNCDIPGEFFIGDETYTFRILENNGQSIPQKIYTKWFDYDIIAASNAELVLRTRRSGDYLRVNSQGERQKLKKYFIEEKIPQEMRKSVLLLAQGSEILWITGHRISEAFKVTKDTKQILEVQRRI